MSLSTDNFIKRNLKRRFTGKYANNRNQRRRKENDNNFSNQFGESNDKDQGQVRGLGLNSWGIDALNLSLRKVSSETFASGKDCNESASKKPLLNLQMKNKPIRGLIEPSDRKSTTSKYSPEELDRLRACAPKCCGHQMQSRLYQVNKSGPNRGRYFYSCTFPMDQKCNFFLWLEDNPDLIDSSFLKALQINGNSAEDRISVSLKYYQRKLDDLTKDQLINELKKFNARISIHQKLLKQKHIPQSFFLEFLSEGKSFIERKLMTWSGKSKEDIYFMLLEEGKWFLSFHERCKEKIRKSLEVYFGTETKPLSKPLSKQIEKERVVTKPADDDGMICLSDSEDEDVDEDENVDRAKDGHKAAAVEESDDDESSLEIISKRSDSSFDNKDEDDKIGFLKKCALWYFGYHNFRSGQLWAIERCLQGRKSLLVMPTGLGKSLCYILPTLLLPGITVVISPLIALMNDQITKLPPEIPAICYTSQLSTQDISEFVYYLLQNSIKLIFISPEKFVSYGFQNLLTKIQHKVSLVCIDEAHCLSHWSYNFRPSFLRICQTIKKFKLTNILALTATASEKVQKDILKHLDMISDDAKVLSSSESEQKSSNCLHINETRNNLYIYAQNFSILQTKKVVVEDDENEEEKKQKLIQLIKRQNFTSQLSSSKGIEDSEKNGKREQPLTIVYVWKRKDAEILGECLKGNNIENVVYHGGMESNRREIIQKNFDRGNVKCIIATIAFGMGIDKQDIRQVVHYNLPKSLENYIQEIGRAGRDGEKSSCFLFYSLKETLLQSSLSHSSHISKLQIFLLLLKIFPFLSSSQIQRDDEYFTSINIQEIEKELDISSTLLETILSILELSPFQYLNLQRSHYDCITGKFRFMKEKYEKFLLEIEEYEMKKSTIQDEAQRKIEAYKVLQWKLLKEIIEKNESLSDQDYGNEDDEEDDGDSDEEQLRELWSSTIDNSSTADFNEKKSKDYVNYSLFPDYGHSLKTNEFAPVFPLTVDSSSSQSKEKFRLKFQNSKTQLSNSLKLSIDTICELLYQIQKTGLIEYQLKDLHFYLQIFTKKCPFWQEIPTQSASSVDRFSIYIERIYRLSNEVHQLLENIQQDNSYSIQKMYKIANLIAKYQPITPLNKFQNDRSKPAQVDENHNNNDLDQKNQLLQQFILNILNEDKKAIHTSSIVNTTRNDKDQEKDDDDDDDEDDSMLSLDKLWSEYTEISFPFSSIDTSKKFQIISEMKVVLNDKSFQSFYKSLLSFAQKILLPESSSPPPPSSSSSSSSEMISFNVDERKEILKLLQKYFLMEKTSFHYFYVMKVFYGFHSVKLMEIQHSSLYQELWGKYRNFDYYQLFSILLNYRPSSAI